MRFKDRADAGGRDADILDLVGADLGEVGDEVGQVSVERDRHGVIGLGGEVDEVDGTELLVRECAALPGEGLEVEAVVFYELLDLFGPGVVSEQTNGTVAIGEEVYGVAEPQRIGVVGVFARHLGQVERLEVDDPDGLGLATAVALPRGTLPLQKGVVSQMAAIGREGAGGRRGQRQALGQAGAVGVHAIKIEVGADGVLHAAHQQVAAIRGPAGEVVARGVEGDTPGDAAGRGQRVYIGVSGDVCGVGDGTAVRGKVGAAVDVAGRGKPARYAAFAGNGPDVIGIAKGDLVLGERGRAQEVRRFGEQRGGDQKCGDEGGGSSSMHGVPDVLK